MSTRIWLTDEDSDLVGYKHAKIGTRSDCASLVQAVTATATGPTSIQATRSSGGTALAWITDPLDGPKINAASWTVRVWASESAVAANVGLHLDVYRYDVAEAGSALLSYSGTTELSTSARDVNLTTGVATATQFNDGDRLVFKLSIVDAGGTMASGNTATIAYNGAIGRAEGDSYLVCPDTLTLTATLPVEDIQAIRDILKDAGQANPLLSDEEIEAKLAQAIRTYSIDRPRVLAGYMSGTSTAFDFSLPSKFVWNLSRIISVEYPADQQYPIYLDSMDWTVLEKIVHGQPVRFLRFPYQIPDSGTNNILVKYTTRHEHSDEYSTIPPEDLEAVLWLAASYAAITLSAKSAATTDSTIDADSVNYRDAETRWGSVAKRLKEMYENRVINPDSAAPAGFTDEWDSMLSTRGEFMWHPRRWR